MPGNKTSTPYLFKTNTGYRVIGQQGKNSIDQYFKKSELEAAKKAAKEYSEKLSKAIKGFITRQELASQIGIQDTGLEKAKAANTALWKSITNKMEVKTIGSREYYKYKGNEAESLKDIKSNSGAAAFSKPRKLYGGKENVITKIRNILSNSKTPITIRQIKSKLPNVNEDTIGNAFSRLKKTDLKDKIKLISAQETAEATAKTKALKRAPYINIVRDVFVENPDATASDVAEATVGTEKYKNASKLSKYNYDNAAGKNIIKFLSAVAGTGSKQIIKDFKNINPDKLGDILESIESRIHKFGFDPNTKRIAQFAISDAAKNLPPGTSEKLMTKLRAKGKAVDHVVPIGSVFKDAPGYTEAGQVIDFGINKKKGNTLDADFGKVFKKVLKGDFSGVENFNKKSLDFAAANSIDTPIIIKGNNLNPRDYIENFDEFSEGAKKNILDLTKEKGFVIQTKTKTLAMLNKVINGAEKLSETDQIKFCNLLSNGGLPGDCKQALKADPEKAAKILSEAPVTSAAMKNVKQDSQKLIRLFRGESFPQRNIKSMKRSAKHFGTTLAEMKKDKLSGQWFTPEQSHAAGYLARPGQMKYVDVTPAELEAIDKFKTKVNQTNVKYSKRAQMGQPYKQSVTTSPHHKIIPRYKLKQMEEADRLKTKLDLNFLKKGRWQRDLPVKSTAGVLEWNSELGGFVDSANPSEIVGQNQLKTWAADNPINVRAGTEDAFKPISNSLLKNVGRTLAKVGAPLPTALIDSYFIGKQIQDDKPAAEIAKDPLNWLGLATMSTLTGAGGLTKAGVAAPGAMSSILRMGMNPGLIRGISRFAGLPGLAISTGLTAYDQYKKYQNEEGLIYNLFNDSSRSIN